MFKRLLFLSFLFSSLLKLNAQEKSGNYKIGFAYGLGSEFNNRNYTFENHFYKLLFYYKIEETANLQYEILIQPEINFAKHQLLNLYFVKPETPDFEQKRTEYLKLKDVREYVLNIGFLIRKPIGKNSSCYILGSIGPMINDTETERMSEGFAFADVLAVGFTVNINRVQVEIRPGLRHVSNAGLGSSNAGYNTKNIEFGISYQL